MRYAIPIQNGYRTVNTYDINRNLGSKRHSKFTRMRKEYGNDWSEGVQSTQYWGMFLLKCLWTFSGIIKSKYIHNKVKQPTESCSNNNMIIIINKKKKKKKTSNNNNQKISNLYRIINEKNIFSLGANHEGAFRWQEKKIWEKDQDKEANKRRISLLLHEANIHLRTKDEQIVCPEIWTKNLKIIITELKKSKEKRPTKVFAFFHKKYMSQQKGEIWEYNTNCACIEATFSNNCLILSKNYWQGKTRKQVPIYREIYFFI